MPSDSSDYDSEVMSAISAFKQILEIMPQDQGTLEALADAYQQVGDVDEANAYRLQLGEVFLEEGDEESALDIAAELAPFSKQVPGAPDFLKRCEALDADRLHAAARAVAVAASEAEGAALFADLISGFSMADELRFAWNLMQAELVNQEEYSVLLQDLTEHATSSDETTVSVLHTLEACSFRNLERVYSFVIQRCGTPLISLASVDLQYEALELVPYDLMCRRGVLPFGLLGRDVLCTVMNPFNTTLCETLSERLERRCHFFVVLPSEFDDALERARAMIDDHAQALI